MIERISREEAIEGVKEGTVRIRTENSPEFKSFCEDLVAAGFGTMYVARDKKGTLFEWCLHWENSYPYLGAEDGEAVCWRMGGNLYFDVSQIARQYDDAIVSELVAEAQSLW